jgi:hypothetical protein
MGIIQIKGFVKGGLNVIFPYGEWVILCLALATWAEKRPSRRFFFMLIIAWLIGKGLELVFPSPMPWHWHFARLAVMLFFGVWALQRSERRILPFLTTSFLLSVETLFLVNDPGVIPGGTWLFTFALLLIAWLSAKSYWGTAAAFTGSLLLNQALVRFINEGIVRYAEFPDTYVWNLGVGIFVGWAGLRLGWKHWLKREKQKSGVKQLVTVEGVGVYEQVEEQNSSGR